MVIAAKDDQQRGVARDTSFAELVNSKRGFHSSSKHREAPSNQSVPSKNSTGELILPDFENSDPKTMHKGRGLSVLGEESGDADRSLAENSERSPSTPANELEQTYAAMQKEEKSSNNWHGSFGDLIKPDSSFSNFSTGFGDQPLFDEPQQEYKASKSSNTQKDTTFDPFASSNRSSRTALDDAFAQDSQMRAGPGGGMDDKTVMTWQPDLKRNTIREHTRIRSNQRMEKLRTEMQSDTSLVDFPNPKFNKPSEAITSPKASRRGSSNGAKQGGSNGQVGLVPSSSNSKLTRRLSTGTESNHSLQTSSHHPRIARRSSLNASSNHSMDFAMDDSNNRPAARSSRRASANSSSHHSTEWSVGGERTSTHHHVTRRDRRGSLGKDSGHSFASETPGDAPASGQYRPSHRRASVGHGPPAFGAPEKIYPRTRRGSAGGISSSGHNSMVMSASHSNLSMSQHRGQNSMMMMSASHSNLSMSQHKGSQHKGSSHRGQNGGLSMSQHKGSPHKTQNRMMSASHSTLSMGASSNGFSLFSPGGRQLSNRSLMSSATTPTPTNVNKETVRRLVREKMARERPQNRQLYTDFDKDDSSSSSSDDEDSGDSDIEGSEFGGDSFSGDFPDPFAQTTPKKEEEPDFKETEKKASKKSSKKEGEKENKKKVKKSKKEGESSKKKSKKTKKDDSGKSKKSKKKRSTHGELKKSNSSSMLKAGEAVKPKTVRRKSCKA